VGSEELEVVGANFIGLISMVKDQLRTKPAPTGVGRKVMINHSSLTTHYQSVDLKTIIFDHGISEELIAHYVELLFGGGFVSSIEGDFDIFTDADTLNIVIAHVFQTRSHCGPCGIEDGGA
jgi:hypothetical protein